MGSFWSQPLRVECRDMAQLITCRTINSALWFVNNRAFEEKILTYLAKYVEKYDADVYAFVFVGNHYHMIVRFPHGNRSQFFRDFNARIAECVRHYVQKFRGGPLFERRFTPQILPLDEDVRKYFFYAALQPVCSGLCQKLSDYRSYNSFNDARYGIKRKFKLFSYGAYNAAKRNNPHVSKLDFTEEYELSYKRLPGMEDMSKREYAKSLLGELERRRRELIQQRLAEGKSFLGKEKLQSIIPGSFPQSTKKGGIRPLVLSVSAVAKRQVLSWYFAVVMQYRRAIDEYRRGIFTVVFPPDTFRPSGICIEVT